MVGVPEDVVRRVRAHLARQVAKQAGLEPEEAAARVLVVLEPLYTRPAMQHISHTENEIHQLYILFLVVLAKGAVRVT